MSYRDPRVVEEMSSHFIAVDLDIGEEPQLARAHEVLWTPHIVMLSDRGIRLREFEGFVPPEELLAQLRMARAFYAFRCSEHARAFELFASASILAPTRDLAGEAIFWQGIAAYRRDRAKASVWAEWARLISDYPETTWARRTTMADGGGPAAPGRAPRAAATDTEGTAAD